ncbi:Alpha/Beta hydrolase protein [Pilaira anomala]|nr:Alpha/Beta hydrolase protein [Pilaira anomala]
MSFTRKKRMRPSGYWRYVIGVYKNLFLAFYFNWTVIFTAPLSSLAFIFIYPVISYLLFAFEICLKIFMDYGGGTELSKRISLDYGCNFGVINWGAPHLLLSEKSSNLIQSTLDALGQHQPDTSKEPIDEHRHRTFDISIAQTMTILSSLVYERFDEKVTEAHNVALDFKKKNKGKRSSITAEQVEAEMKKLIWDSERPIRKIARGYGLQFAGVTELKSLGGPFCGLFWSMDPDKPFIVVAFKGTTPTNYSEFLVDATLQRTDARSYLFGSAHEGFYDSLFPSQIDDEDAKDPYYAIQCAVKSKARQLQESSNDPNRPIPVWITGHSLGAAMGTLLFARWLKCPEDIGTHCIIRDAYVIGLPAVGDNDFASIFASYSNAPLGRTSTLWRIINKSDIISRIPPGYNNMTIGHYVPQTDFFNYSHVGHAVQITHTMLDPNPLWIYPSTHQTNLKVDVIVSDTDVPKNRKRQLEEKRISNLPFAPMIEKYPWWIQPWIKRVVNPIPILESFYPFFLRDHIPIHYFEGLERARAYYKTRDMCQNH